MSPPITHLIGPNPTETSECSLGKSTPAAPSNQWVSASSARGDFARQHRDSTTSSEFLNKLFRVAMANKFSGACCRGKGLTTRKPHWCTVMIVVGALADEEGYRNVRRYSAGVMPMARRNARVKLDCEENWHSRAISESDARPVAIIALALSSRRPLT